MVIKEIATRNIIEFQDSNAEVLLSKDVNGNYGGQYAKHGKDWCDGFWAGYLFRERL